MDIDNTNFDTEIIGTWKLAKVTQGTFEYVPNASEFKLLVFDSATIGDNCIATGQFKTKQSYNNVTFTVTFAGENPSSLLYEPNGISEAYPSSVFTGLTVFELTRSGVTERYEKQ